MSQTCYQNMLKLILEDSDAKIKQLQQNKNFQSPKTVSTRREAKSPDSNYQVSEKYYSVDSSKQDTYMPSNLPSIAEIITVRTGNLDPEIKKTIIELTKYAQNLEHIIRSKDHEIERLVQMNKYLTAAQQTKDQMLTQTFEENRKLRETNYTMEKLAASRKLKTRRVDLQELPQVTNPSHRAHSQKSSLSIAKGTEGDTLRPSTAATMASMNESMKFPASPLLAKHKSSASSASPLSSVTKPRDGKKKQSVLDMNEDDLHAHFNKDTNLAQLETIMKSEDIFISQICSYDRERLSCLYDVIKAVKDDQVVFKGMIFKLKRIIKATIAMTTSLMLDEAVVRITDEVSQCLDCDRASTFIYDATRDELWSKSAKGSDEPIRIPPNRGIAGYVFTKGETLNIHNAYLDERFNKAVDLKTGYKTNTILTVPIIGESNQVIGVMQGINKNGIGAIFNKDDESLMTILANIASVILKNSMTYKQQLSYQHALRSALKSGVYLNSIHNLSHLLPAAEKTLKSLMGLDKAQIILKDNNKNELFSIAANGSKHIYPIGCGIVGKVIENCEYENIMNGYSCPIFNALIDIETSMPLLCMPIPHPMTPKAIGAIEIINTKGIQGMAAQQKASVSPLDKELMEFFSNHLAQAIVNCYEYERLKEKAGETDE